MSSFQTDSTVYPEDIECIVDPVNGKGGIFISNVEAASNILTLMKHNIKAVLTAANNINLTHSKAEIPHYKKIPGEDHEKFDLSKYFDESVQFIENSLRSTNILVHCMAGVSRSVSLVLAFLIKNKGMTYNDAYSFVKSKRKIIYPNDGFISQLKNYEKQHLDKKRLLYKQKYDSPTKNSFQVSQQFSTILSKYESPLRNLTPTKFEATKKDYRSTLNSIYESPSKANSKPNFYESPSRTSLYSPLKTYNNVNISPRKTYENPLMKKYSNNEKVYDKEEQIQQRINNIRKKYSHLENNTQVKNRSFISKDSFYQTGKYPDIGSYQSPSRHNLRKQQANYDKY